jgi:hypothetical protein
MFLEWELPGEQQAWEAEVAIETEHVVWRSNLLTESDRVRVGVDTGSFLGQFSGKDSLDASHVYYMRVRQQSSTGVWSDWSEWHQPFRVE